MGRVRVLAGVACAIVVLSAPGLARAAPPAVSGAGSIAGVGGAPLRDGSTIRVGGLTFTRRCTGGCAGAMTISYAWRACSSAAGTGCVATSLPTTQSPLVDSMVLGPGDVNRFIQATVTATDPNGEPGVEQSRVVRVVSAKVLVWPLDAAPRVDFVAGTPEPTTASHRSTFRLSPVHANPADGAGSVACRLDGVVVGCDRTYTTPVLANGRHTFSATATNSAGSTRRSLTWDVVALPAPVACASCFKPPALAADGRPMTWDWQLLEANGSLVARTVDMFDVDGFDNTAATVAAIRARVGRSLPRQRAVCYMDLGSWENFRPDAAQWPARAVGQGLAGWPGERWVDVRQLSALRPRIDARLQICKSKGFDGVEIDNLDGFANATGFPLTRQDMQPWLVYIANRIHALNMFAVWKNEPLNAGWAVAYFDGALSESCYTFDECTAAQLDGTPLSPGVSCNTTTTPCSVEAFRRAGKWVGLTEYPPANGEPGVCRPDEACSGKASFTNYCNKTWRLPALAGYGFAAFQSDLSLSGRQTFFCWPA